MNMPDRIMNIVTTIIKRMIIFAVIWYSGDFLSGLIISPADTGVKIGVILIPVLVLILLTKPRWSFLALLFTRPLVDPLRVYYFMPDMNILGLFSFAYIIVAVYMVTRSKEFKIIPDKIRWYYFFMLIAALSLFNTTDVNLTIATLTKYLALLALFLLGYNFTKTFEDALKIIRVIVVSSVIPIIYGIYQHIMGFGVQKYQSFQALAGVTRINSTFSLSNAFAFYIGIVILLCILCLYFSKGKKEKVLYLFLIASGLYCLLNTHVRVVWIALFLAMCLLSIYDARARKFFIITIIIALPLSYNLIIDRFQDLFVKPEYGTSSLEFRSGIGKALLQNAVPVHFFLGHGTGDALAVAKAYTNYRNIPHDDFLRVLVENGILGLTAYLLFIGKMFFYLFGLIRKKINLRVNLIFLTILIYYLISSAAQNIFSMISGSGYIFCLMGVASKVNEISMETGEIAHEK